MLTGSDIQDFCRRVALGLPHAELVFPFGPDHEVFRVGQKIFMMITDQPGYPVVTLKTDPEENRVLQLAFASISGGWHMNKRHWISVAEGENITQALLQELVEDAHLRIVLSLPKQKRPIEFRSL